MKGVVPAAGKGTRLEPLTDRQPKALVSVAGQPLLTHVFETLLGVDIDEFVVIVGHLKAQIIEHYGDEFRGVPITYVHQRDQFGLGHAVSLAEPYIDGPFIVFNGDNVFAGSIEPAIEQVTNPGTDGVLLVEAVDRDTARETGVVAADDGVVSAIVEKPADPPTRLVTTGCYVLPDDVFHALTLVAPSDRGEYELSEAVGLLAEAGYRIETVRLSGSRVNINRQEDLERANQFFDD